jgi:hypothetical protein
MTELRECLLLLYGDPAAVERWIAKRGPLGDPAAETAALWLWGARGR